MGTRGALIYKTRCGKTLYYFIRYDSDEVLKWIQSEVDDLRTRAEVHAFVMKLVDDGTLDPEWDGDGGPANFFPFIEYSMDIDTTANADNEWTVSAIYETVKGGREPKPFKRARWVFVLYWHVVGKLTLDFRWYEDGEIESSNSKFWRVRKLQHEATRIRERLEKVSLFGMLLGKAVEPAPKKRPIAKVEASEETSRTSKRLRLTLPHSARGKKLRIEVYEE